MSEKDSLKTRSDEVNVVRAVGSQNSLLLDNVEPVDITVRNLSISVREGVASAISTLFKRKKKVVSPPDEEKLGLRSHILQSISADVPRGTMMAIIGGSGSGKTSMLNVMAQRMSSNSLKIDGEIKFNGMKGISHVRHAYVLQQDILQPRLTCRESLTYAADLRLGSTTSAKDRKRLVEEIILELGLKECADTLVGDSGHKGLSGGEKRRLTIGIQLLANPSVLFLDEPTTGLDANSAYLLVKTCHYLSSVKGRTIVMSIHQPRSDIFFLFDSVTILSRGSSVYSGPIRNVLPYFTDLGHSFPEHINPADRLIDLSAVDTRTPQQEAASLERVNSLIQNWKDNQYFSTVAVSERNNESPKQLMKASLAKEVTILTRRSMLLSFRDPMGILGLLLEAMLMGVVLGLIFLRLKGDLAGIRSMLGLIYAGVSAQAYLILLYETYRLCGPDLKVFDREHNEDCVSVFGYLISRRLAKALTEDLFVPLIFSVSYIDCLSMSLIFFFLLLTFVGHCIFHGRIEN
jgi:ABC-type multidrug transport system ATPase subunit